MPDAPKFLSDTGSPFDIESVDLTVGKPSQVRLMICQHAWPDGHFKFIKGQFSHTDTDFAIDMVAQALRIAEANTVDGIVLPELGVPEQALELARSWSDRTGAVVIGGSHYFQSQQGTISRAPIFISGHAYYSEKINPSPSEYSPIAGESISPGAKITVFRNTSIGNFAVLICADYLDPQLKSKLPLDDLDILFVPAFQRDSSMYHDRMNLDCADRPNGIFIAYSNAAYGEASDGSSSLFGIIDRMYHDKLVQAGVSSKETRQLICSLGDSSEFSIFDLSLERKKPSISRTIHTRPNVQLVKRMAFEAISAKSFSDQIGRTEDFYTRIEEFFVEPNEYGEIVQKLESDNFVFIVGDPGIGKTYTAVRLLRHFFDDGYNVSWLSGLDREERSLQRKTIESFKPNENHIVYFEDPFGRTTYESRDSLRGVFGPLIDSLQGNRSKVIVTSRKEVFEKFSEEAVSGDDLRIFVSEMNIVNPSYSIEKMAEIADNISRNSSWRSIPESRRLVFDAIESKKFATPLSLRDFVRSSETVSDVDELRLRVLRRQREEKDQFISEITSADLSTILVLGLVLQFGSLPSKQLAEIFNNVGTFLDPSQRWSGTSPFFQSLRRQIGHRLEQQGRRAVTLRFLHPYYEEAFVSAYLSDFQVADVLNTTVSAVARKNLLTTTLSIFSSASRYPELCTSLIHHIRPLLLRPGNLGELSIAVNRLSGLYIHWNDDVYLDALKKLISFPDFLELVLGNRDISSTGPSMRAIHNYSLALGTGRVPDSENISEYFDWLLSHGNYAQILDAIDYLVKVFAGYGRKLYDATETSEVVQKIGALNEKSRERFLEVIVRFGTGKGRGLKNLQQRLDLKYNPHAPFKRERLPDQADLNCSVVVDEGAAIALVDGHASLLPVGVVQVNGNFGKDAVVAVIDQSGGTIAFGVTGYNSAEIELIMGKHSYMIPETLGHYHTPSVIRRERLYVLGRP